MGIHSVDINALQGVTNNFKIGPYVLENVNYQIAAKSHNHVGSDAILGYDILRNFIVTIDLMNKNLYLSAG